MADKYQMMIFICHETHAYYSLTHQHYFIHSKIKREPSDLI